MKYQDVLKEKQSAVNCQDWKNVIAHLEALDGYKDSDELLTQAQEALNDAEELEKQQRKKKIIATAVLIVLASLGFGIYKYKERAERLAEEQRIEEARIAREKAIEEARIAKENIMIAFFEGRYGDMTSPDKYSNNPAITNMFAHVDYEKSGSNYANLNTRAESLRKMMPNDSKGNYEEAIKLAGKYANSPSANKFLGDVYMNGWGVDKDMQKAIGYFKLPAEQGDIYSQIALASFYDSLNDKDNASKWYQKLADNGNSEARNKLRAFQEQQKKQEAERVYAEAQASEAKGNLDTALEQYRHAFELGHTEAQKRITAIEEKKKSLEADSTFNFAQYYESIKLYDIAINKYRQAVELGHPEAQKSLTALENRLAQKKIEQERKERESQAFQVDYSQAEAYLNDKNYSQSLEIFRRLANQGYAPAQDKLAWMYQNGWGIEQSYTQAVYWFRKAAEQGNTEALASMGLMYYRGWGVERNYDMSLEWYGKAAAKGSEVAQRRINSIQLLKTNKQKIDLSTLPVSGKIFAETLSVRQSPNTKSRVIKTLRTGHPISISRTSDSDDDYWFYVKTASGTAGWVLGGYVNIIDRDLTYEEISNRTYSLPKDGYVTTSSSSSFLNLRSIPAIEGSQVVEKLDNGTYFTAYEVFAGDTIDWYRIKTYYGTEGWVSGKYIRLSR